MDHSFELGPLRPVDESDSLNPVIFKGRQQVGRNPIHLLVAVPARLGDREIVDRDCHEAARFLRSRHTRSHRDQCGR